jgi:hypothetical protein
MGIIVKTNSQKAEGLNVAPILNAGWPLKKRRMDLRNLNKSITFVRGTRGTSPRLRLRWPGGRFPAGTVK